MTKLLGRHDGGPVICYDDAFEDEPDARVGHMDISVNMDWMHAGAKEQRQRLAAELDTVAIVFLSARSSMNNNS
jgi:hypothetical protein